MKKLFSIAFYSWLVAALCVALLAGLVNMGLTGLEADLEHGFDIAWLGVIVAALAPLVNKFWIYDDDTSVNAKVHLPKVSLLVMIGVAWVLLTVPERGWPIWFVLGILGGFLLNTYWAALGDDK